MSRPTLEDVAELAGVSRATVSRVVTGSPKVSEQARQDVLAAVQKLGYVPNQAARALVTRRTGAVALVVSEPESTVFDDPHFSTVVRTASVELASVDSQLLLMMVQHEEDQARVLRYFSAGHLDGALLLTPHQEDTLPAAIRELPLPVVFGGRPWLPTEGLHMVDNDNVGGGRTATEHLISLGRKKIVSVTGPLDELAAQDRLTGWQQATGANKRQTRQLTASGDFHRDGGERAMTELLDRVPDLDAVFVASDLMALGALDALKQAGKRIPEDVAVVGFDDQPSIAPHTDPPLTTARQDAGEQMRRMVRLLLRLIAGEDVEPGCEMLPTPLIRRASA